MEENTSMTSQSTQTEDMGNESEIQGAAEPGKGKLFTQDEVNSFVQSRISRMKSQITKDAQGEYDQKLAELQSREMKLTVKEALANRNMPRELADIITCTDEADLKSKLDAINKIYGNKAKTEAPTGFVQIGAGGGGQTAAAPDPYRRAMGLD